MTRPDAGADPLYRGEMRWIALVLMLVTTPAFADDKSDAAAHYKQGKAFFDAGAYDKAIDEYQKAYALDRLPSHLFNIGNAYELKGELALAIAQFERFLAVEGSGPRAVDARNHIATATAKLDEIANKQRADAEAARLAAEAKRQQDEQAAAAIKLKILTHTKQADAYAKAGAWTKAGDEHRAAAAIDGDPQHFLDAAAAFDKQPDPTKSREALLAYLEKVPLGPKSDQLRIRVAELTREIEAAETRTRQLAAQVELGKLVPKPAPPRHVSVGGELRGGLFSTGTFVVNNPFREVKNTPGAALGIGLFVEIPVVKRSHIHIGARYQRFSNTFDTDSCPTTEPCPAEISASHFSPVITFENVAIDRGSFELFGVAGLSFAFPLSAKVSFFQSATDQDLEANNLASGEFGVGMGIGPVSFTATFHISISNFTSEFDVGHTQGVLFTGGFTLPR